MNLIELGKFELCQLEIVDICNFFLGHVKKSRLTQNSHIIKIGGI